MKTDTSEKGLESLIVETMTGVLKGELGGAAVVREKGQPLDGTGWILGDAADYNREYALDLAQLGMFLFETQEEAAKTLDLGNDSPMRRKFLARLQGEISKRGTIDVLRKGIKHGPLSLELFKLTGEGDNCLIRALAFF